MNYKIGEVIRMLEVSRQSLYNWERDGYIPTIHRTPTNQRVYSETDIQVIRDYIAFMHPKPPTFNKHAQETCKTSDSISRFRG